jgi:hypothetical protein
MLRIKRLVLFHYSDVKTQLVKRLYFKTINLDTGIGFNYNLITGDYLLH